VAAPRRDPPQPTPQRGHGQTFVVCAAFDAAADAGIERLRDQVAAAGHRVRRAHRPHFTLTAARTGDLDDVLAVAAEVAARHTPIGLTMTGLGSFPSGVLFVAPKDSRPLRDLQRDAHGAMSRRWPPAFGSQSAPDKWIAHCTLATRLPRTDLHTLQRSSFEPFPATVQAVTVIAVGGSGDLARFPLAEPQRDQR
jgi:2'-5' RNA ligase